MNKSGISIILPVYNRIKFLEQAINSVLKQTYQHWELIIADDNSDSETRAFLNKYPILDRRIKIYRNPKNLGLFANLNKAISNAENDYLFILCSDDYLLPNCLQTFLEFQEEYPSAKLILPFFNLVDSEGNNLGHSIYFEKIIPKTVLLPPHESVPLLLKYGSFNGTITGFFFNKIVFHELGGFNENWKQCSDWEWLYRVAKDSPILVSRISTMNIRRHKEQLTQQNAQTMIVSVSETSQIIKLLLSDNYLRDNPLANRWAAFQMQSLLFVVFKSMFSRKLIFFSDWKQNFALMKIVHETTGLPSTLFEMFRVLPQRLNKKLKNNSFIFPPE